MKWQREWSGLDGTPDAWKLEIDTDRMAFDRPATVTVYVENPGEKGDLKDEAGLAELSSESARELAAALLEEADNCDRVNRLNGDFARSSHEGGSDA